MMYYLNSMDPDEEDFTWEQNNEARDMAQAEKFRHYIDDHDEDRTLTLADLETRDFAQLAALRKSLAVEPLPFENFSDEDLQD
jgi:hypothetical protein